MTQLIHSFDVSVSHAQTSPDLVPDEKLIPSLFKNNYQRKVEGGRLVYFLAITMAIVSTACSLLSLLAGRLIVDVQLHLGTLVLILFAWLVSHLRYRHFSVNISDASIDIPELSWSISAEDIEAETLKIETGNFPRPTRWLIFRTTRPSLYIAWGQVYRIGKNSKIVLSVD